MGETGEDIRQKWRNEEKRGEERERERERGSKGMSAKDKKMQQ
jgi:hypothetical protein